MSEMVERVAKELYEATPFKQTAGGFEEQSDVYQRMCTVLARTAIAAMREPTAKMVGAGCDEEKVGYAPDGAPAEYVWRAMIDAALAEDELS